MRLVRFTRPAHPATDPAALALLRRGLVAPGLLAGPKRRERGAPLPAETGVRALEADALSLGYVVGARLRAYLCRQEPNRLAALGSALLTGLASLVGAHVPHLPLFRNFPSRVPASTDDLYVLRMFALLTQPLQATCVLCGQAGTVHPVDPCAHPVCAACWDLQTWTACPICHRRTGHALAHLDEATWRPGRTVPRGEPVDTAALPRRWVLLELSEHLDDDLHDAVAALLARRTPLTAQETADLDALLDRIGHADLGWLPDTIEVRATRAHVLHRLLADPGLAERLPDLLARHVTTATDLLRLLYLRDGGDVHLTRAPRRRTSLPRRLRRLVLARLDALPLTTLVEDLHRHRDAWLRTAENLHPFEEPARHPHAALGFAVLRRTVVDPASKLGVALGPLADAHPDLTRTPDGRLRLRGWRAHTETALRGGDHERALALLARRPGELLRRTVMLAARFAARPGEETAFLLTVADAASRVAPGVLLAALSAVRAATHGPRPRLYFPAAGGARLWTEPDRRERLPAALGGELEALLTDELLRRAAARPRTPVAVLDAGLADLVAPFAERTASATLVALPRGSVQPLPSGAVVRLFLHWTEPAGTRVDLDLSVALYDDTGRFVGLCDYTRLRFAGQAAVHSGDLTSAPAPLGASEFVDLDVARLRAAGVRYLVMVVFSYNDVAFEEMTDAFAGFMGEPPGADGTRRGPFRRGGAPFQPQRVEQRFDLTGAEKVATPLLVDLERYRMRWLDVTLAGSGATHSVADYSHRLGQLAIAADGYFDGGFRPSLWEVACWHAAARADLVQVRADGVRAYHRQPGESLRDFAARLTHLGPAEETSAGQPQPATFAALVRGDAPVRDAARVYALHPDGLDTARVRRHTAADLVAQLAPVD
ncbi:MXAN_6230/SCO0854 family RING domain-containing protein [Micromonospora coxensis]|uniref:RING finger family protein 4 n=1 Tax=Micromonospora coxensis TaxID=356852 RepID=A0A1C5JN34_9ACTN|nr:MXAN_6230/SCO0854 family RING domain-containing protein [Micromonospora coxensis]SCG71995.1 RING finger family protein 4 [Micromonospora coxensis]